MLVNSAGRFQRVVRPDFGHPSVIQHHNLVSVRQRRNPVRNQNDAGRPEPLCQRRTNLLIRFRIHGGQRIKIDPAKRQISGWVNNQRFVNNSKTFRSYFVVQFDKAFEDYGMWENQKDEIYPKKLEGT